MSRKASAAVERQIEEDRRDVPPGVEVTEDAERGERFAAACAAFVKAQAEFGPIAFDKTNPHFKSRYASLAALQKAPLPALTRHGIAHTSRTVIDGDTITVKTYLIHNGVAFVKASWPVGKTSTPPQQLGSALTYARRYTLQSILGVAADDDDDGNAAQTANAADPF